MKKYVFTVLTVFCLVFILGSAQVSAQHFDYDEAYQILNGKWIDETGEKMVLVWKSYDGSECNIVNNKGYTDPKGESKIFFDYKGMRAEVMVTYYPNEGSYYAKMWKINDGRLSLFRECLAKE